MRMLEFVRWLALLVSIGGSSAQILDGSMSVVACEDSVGEAECPSGTAIWIEAGFYGRNNEETCSETEPRISSTSCSAANVRETLRRMCEGRTACEVAASNDVFGNPCNGTFKFLEFEYSCRPASFVTICRKQGEISCPEGYTVNIISGFYGRKHQKTCPSILKRRNRNTSCRSSNALDVFREDCQGKMRCTLSSKRSNFKNPCLFTKKYMEASFTCIMA